VINMGVVVALMPLMSALLSVFWMIGIKQLDIARSSLFMDLLPIFVALAASSLLGEQLRSHHAVGGLFALARVWWGQRPPKVTA